MTRSASAALFTVSVNGLAFATRLDCAFPARLFVIRLARTTIVFAIGSALPPDGRLVVSVAIMTADIRLAVPFGVAIVLSTAVLATALLTTALRPIVVRFAATPIGAGRLLAFPVVTAATRLRLLFRLGTEICRPLVILVGRSNDVV